MTNERQAAQLRLLDLIAALERQIDPDMSAQNQIMEMSNNLAALTDWIYDNPDLDIAQHPQYAGLVGEPCGICFGRLEKRTRGLWCAACERMM